MIGAAVVAVLVVVALAYVLLPLLTPGPRRNEPTTPDPDLEARQRKHAALAAIVDLEREHAMGKLGDDDLEALRRSLEAEALEALRSIDRSRPIQPAGAAREGDDDKLEREIAEMRARLRCPACGAPRSQEPPCPRCGAGSPAPST